jgi:hypothetical protein
MEQLALHTLPKALISSFPACARLMLLLAP